jgi:PKD repeat protein
VSVPHGLAGKYITATATDAAGNTSEFSRAVLVGGTATNQPPLAVAIATPTSGAAPLAVSFSSSGSRDPDGAIVGILWDFGDGATSTLAKPTHTYAGGTFTASLTVTDDAGATGRTSVTITVAATPVPTMRTAIVLQGTVRPNRWVVVNGQVTVTDAKGSRVPGAAVSTTWTLPDGTRQSQSITTDTTGVATVSVRVSGQGSAGGTH